MLRALLLFGTAAWLGGGQLLAQTLPPPQQRFVAIGCVSRSGDQFVITDSRGEEPTVYRIDGDRAKLELHVGHTLEIAGPLQRVTPPARGQNASSAPAYTIKAEKITWVSTRCHASP